MYLPSLSAWVFMETTKSRGPAEMEDLSQYIRGVSGHSK